MTKFYEGDDEPRTIPVQNIIILSASLDEARRICEAARWPRGGIGAPRLFDVRNGQGNIEKLYGLQGGLVLITEGAMKYGISQEFFVKAAINHMLIMCVIEPKFSTDSVSVPKLEVNL